MSTHELYNDGRISITASKEGAKWFVSISDIKDAAYLELESFKTFHEASKWGKRIAKVACNIPTADIVDGRSKVVECDGVRIVFNKDAQRGFGSISVMSDLVDDLNVTKIEIHDLREGADDSLGAVQALVTLTDKGNVTPIQLIWQNQGDGELYLCGDEVEHDLLAVARAIGVDGGDVWAVRESLSAVTVDVQAEFDEWRAKNVGA